MNAAVTVQADRNLVSSYLSRSQTVSEFQALGLDAQDARDRVASMTDSEISTFAGQINAVPDRVELREVPFFAQQEYQCGPAALATTLVHAGTPVIPEELVKRVYLPGREGSLQAEMLAAPRRYGKVSYQIAPRLDDLLREVAAGNPVLVLQDTGAGPITNRHYAVVVGFDYPAGELYLRSGETRPSPCRSRYSNTPGRKAITWQWSPCRPIAFR